MFVFPASLQLKEILNSFWQSLDGLFRIILPSITHGLIVWGGCSNLENFNSLERLHCRAARIIYSLPRDMSSSDVLDRVKWPSIFRQYKVELFNSVKN